MSLDQNASGIVAEEHDPTAEDEFESVTTAVAESPDTVPSEELFTQEPGTVFEDDAEDVFDLDIQPPAPEPAAVVEPPVPTLPTSTNFFSAFKPVDPETLSDREIPQRLPMQLVTEEDLDICYRLCEQQIKALSGEPDKQIALQNVLEAFYLISFNTYGKDFRSFFERNRDALTQYVVGNKGVKIRTSYPDFKLENSNEILSGKAAMRYVNKAAGTGNVTKIPCWHSGLVLTIDPFPEQELLDLNLALSRQQIELGINTRGACFTGDDIHVVGTIVELILSHVVDANLKDFDRTSLNKLLLATDIQSILAGGLAAIYPGGYPVFHACVNQEAGKCNYNLVARRKENGDFYPDSMLDFTKLLWVNRGPLSNEDINVMSAGSRTQTYDEIKKYQERVKGYAVKDCYRTAIWTTGKGDKEVTFLINFKTPNLVEYATSSHNWINNVRRMTEVALAAETDLTDAKREERRSKIITSYTSVTDLVKHACWVDYISIMDARGNTKVINNEKSIVEALENFIKIDGFKERFEVAAQNFKENVLIAWTGFNNFECPECHAGQADPESKTPSLIPINMAGYFFTIMEWRRQMLHSLD